jgi:guanosine-3',5'-bis(diphosphate) 3'-pyrophosphohydrolase
MSWEGIMEDNKVISSTTNSINTNNTSNQQTTTLDPHLEPCTYTIRLINKLKSLDISNTLDFDLINKAIYWARKYHGSQMRKSGEPYYTHPLEVAYLLSVHNRPTTNLIVVSILHDIIEDTEVTAGMILDNFGFRIAEMVDALTRDRPDGTKLSVEEILNNALERDDNEVLLIKVMDRVHNMMTIESMSIEKQRKIALETLNEFITISCYLDNIKYERILTELSSAIINKDTKDTIDTEFLKSINISSSLGKLTFGYK